MVQKKYIKNEQEFEEAKRVLAVSSSQDDFGRRLGIPLGTVSSIVSRLKEADTLSEYNGLMRERDRERRSSLREEKKRLIRERSGEALFWEVHRALKTRVLFCKDIVAIRPELSYGQARLMKACSDYQEYLKSDSPQKRVSIAEGVFQLVKFGFGAGYLVEEIAKETGISELSLKRIQNAQDYEEYIVQTRQSGEKYISRERFQIYEQQDWGLPAGIRKLARGCVNYEEFCRRLYLKRELSWWNSETGTVVPKDGVVEKQEAVKTEIVKTEIVKTEAPQEKQAHIKTFGSKGLEIHVLAKADCELVLKIIDL